MNFLSFLVASSENITFFLRVCSSFFAAHDLQSTALDPDYDLFIDYQMPADKHEGLNACLRLRRKNLNNFAKLSFHSSHYMNHRSNAECYENPSVLVLSLSTPCLIGSK